MALLERIDSRLSERLSTREDGFEWLNGNRHKGEQSFENSERSRDLESDSVCSCATQRVGLGNPL
ncbi:hypothetical protein NIES2104_57020 [Leptolyngbya sp. NIES-2104]|nr:hypothetical protein NIES2104_57020 [Leptolyngbya sp. NIES-2104]